MKQKRLFQRVTLRVLALTALMLTATTMWATKFSMYICGIRVTSSNYKNLTTIEGVTGTVKFDPLTNTLTLKDAGITYTTTSSEQTACALLLGIDGLKVKVTGDCTIDCTGNNGLVVGGVGVNVTLTGTGTLTVKGKSAVQLLTTTAQLTVDGPTLVAQANAKGGHGICGMDHSSSGTYYGILNVQSGKVTATGYSSLGELGAAGASVAELKTLKLGDDMYIASPVSAVFSNHAVTNGGSGTYTGDVVIQSMRGTPLTLEAINAGTVTIDNQRKLNIGYAVNGGAITWGSGATIEIPLTAGKQVAFYGDNASYATGSLATIIQCSADCYVYGNVMSLISSTGFKDLTELTGQYTFRKLFYQNKHIKNHASKPLLLPATTLSKNCYRLMFYNCDALTSSPVLPATTLAVSCYDAMFQNCGNLVTPPELPATTLAEGCYSLMFYGCKSLTTAPELPALTLTEKCYYNMFYHCSSLTTAPELPANTLVNNCYYEMFSGCTKLNYVTCLATDISATTCKTRWLESVSATGTFEKANGFTGWETGASGIPEGWTVTEDTSKQPCGLAFSTDEVTLTYGDVMVRPELTNPDELPVTYTSSKPTVATVNASTGELTLLTAGTTVITASFEGDATHYPGYASYTLHVVSKGDAPELAFDREAIAVTKGKSVTAPKLTIPDGLTATYKSSNTSVVTINSTTGALSINNVGTATITVTTPATIQYAAGTATYYIMVLNDAEKFRCDSNGDGNVTITDAVNVVDYILNGGE